MIFSRKPKRASSQDVYDPKTHAKHSMVYPEASNETVSSQDAPKLPIAVAAWDKDKHGGFLVGSTPLKQAVEMAGGTPCYIYDREKIRDRIVSLKSRLNDNVAVHYAIKANPMPAVVGSFVGLADGFDVASGRELVVAIDSGMDPSRISIAGPGKSRQELKQALAAGAVVNLESTREIGILKELQAETGIQARVAVRCNLPFELRSSGMKMSGGPKQFGIDEDQLSDMLSDIAKENFEFVGFHLFTGSQNLSAESIIDSQIKCYDFAMKWAPLCPSPPKKVNIGGGLGIVYNLHDKPLDVDPVIDNINALSQRLRTDLPGAQLVMELGRYLVGESGLYVCSVRDRKMSHGHPFLVTDGGMHQHLAASGNFGQVIRKNYPVWINEGANDMEAATVVGPLCTPLDSLASKAKLPVSKVGDLVVIFQSGAYGKTASPRDFLSHPDVGELLV